MLRTVRVPAEIEPIFAVAEEAVSRFFRSRIDDPEHGTIEIFGERYILVRAASLSVEFFALVEQLFGPGREGEADQFARNILFDLAHALGKSDARNFHRKMNLTDPIAKLSAGPVHFSHSGWAFVDIFPESRPVPNDDYYLIFDHPYSFESDAWLRAGKARQFPACIMNAGWSSGWCEESFGLDLVSFEVMCRAKGDSTCRFIMAPPKRIEAHVRAFLGEGAETGKLGERNEIPDFFARKRDEEELKRLYARLQELDALKTQFFANVSHELRTPLMLISGPVDKLLADERLSEEQRDSLEVVQRNARILLKHVNDLLDVAKLEAGRMEARHVKTDLVALVRLVAANFDAFAAQRQISYHVDAPASLVADVDPDKMGRVLVNLLSNAFKFARGAIRVRLRAEGERAVVEVADDGPGVPPEMRDLIFERFRQADGGPTRRFGGTGLGLAIARDFVELHGGQITVRQAPEGGALFTVAIPLAAPRGVVVETGGAPRVDVADDFMIHPGPTRRRAQAPADAPRLLLVEDNHDMLRFLAEALESEYQIETACDGQEGLEKAISSAPDLIITDVMLPRKSGDDLVREVRRRDEFAGVPIIVLTAKADDDLRIRLFGEGAQDYLAKPFSSDELRARVRNLVTMKRTRDVLQGEVASKRENLEQLAREIVRSKHMLAESEAREQAARAAAENAVHVRDDFVAIAGHELKTPLAALLLQIQSLQRAMQKGQTPNVPEQLERAARSGVRLDKLVNQLLDVSRITAGRLALEPEPVGLVDLVREVVSRFADAGGGTSGGISVHAAEEIRGCWDRLRIEQVVSNLVANAVKYGLGKPVAVEVTAASGHAVVRIIDHGIGIDREHQKKIFERFERAVSTREFGGFGLGLWITREIVHASGGTIEVESEPNRGSTFTVRLPLVLQPEQHAST